MSKLGHTIDRTPKADVGSKRDLWITQEIKKGTAAANSPL